MAIQFTETVLRDANQSLVATRLGFGQFAPILQTIDRRAFIPWSVGAVRPLMSACVTCRRTLGSGCETSARR